ncbi:MAG TPA: Na+/H+ antiporter NhaA [Sphingobacteriaceae bacterium]|nr:Na+/H+ antiporter NhaA [Sphingobacteriaceae bacterium]
MSNLINLKPFKDFLKSGSAGSVILLSCVAISLLIANSSLGPAFQNLLDYNIGWESSSIELRYPIISWINDGLMAIFFLLVGLEIKRELVEGELSSFKQASLPIIAALGGVAFPALIYYTFNASLETQSGWAIPMATDIAFALAVIGILGKSVPTSLKIMLAALAIVDDLMAIIVIAIFYPTTDLVFTYLLYAGGIFAMLIAFNRLGMKNIVFYIIPGIFMWYFIHHSGIHATIAGVLVAITLPTTPDAKESSLEKLEHLIMKPVNFLIMPLFALANTNIKFESGMVEGLFTPLGMGIVLGLFIGKPVGIIIASWLSIKTGLSRMPDKAGWSHIVGVGMLAGIGFTMSIFISILSFATPDLLAEAKFSILIGSLLSGIIGSFLLKSLHKRT